VSEPIDEVDDRGLQHTIKVCDLLRMQSELDRRVDFRLNGSALNEGALW
jgi:hypothetical protein